MDTLKNDLSIAENKEAGIKSKCVGLGAGQIESAQESNIIGVQENASVYEKCSIMLKEYKVLLDSDATHIKELGVNFFELDHQMAKGS